MTLELRFEQRAGRTHLVHRCVEAPFALGRPFDLGDGVLTVFVQSVAGVIRGGERWDTSISIGLGASARIVHTAAVPVHAGCEPGSIARIGLRVEADDDSMVEIISAPLVILDGASVRCTTDIATTGTGATIVLEAVTHHGGRSSVDQQLEADVYGHHCRDRCAYQWPLDQMGLPDGRHASLWWFQHMSQHTIDVAAMAALPNDCGWLGRATGDNASSDLYERLDAMRAVRERSAHPQRLIDITRGRGPRGTTLPAR
jgi:hypothetical protein